MAHIDQHKTLSRSIDHRKNKGIGKIAGKRIINITDTKKKNEIETYTKKKIIGNINQSLCHTYKECRNKRKASIIINDIHPKGVKEQPSFNRR